MKLTILLLVISVCAFGQPSQKPNDTNQNGSHITTLIKADTLSVPGNAIQLDRLNIIQGKITDDQKSFGEILELIFGYKIEEIEWWAFKNGKFLFILKPKKK